MNTINEIDERLRKIEAVLHAALPEDETLLPPSPSDRPFHTEGRMKCHRHTAPPTPSAVNRPFHTEGRMKSACGAAWEWLVFSMEASPMQVDGGLPSPAALLAPSRDLLSRGGKRWRPLLALLVCEAFGGKDRVLPLLPLVEFCHNASLIHDDIEDNSAERRGKPAVHLLYGEDAAINSGCFLYFLPLVCIDTLEASARFKAKLYSLWGLSMRRLHLGQSLDIDWHKRADFTPSIDDYRTMCSLKTGVLARFSAELGILAASLNDECSPGGCGHGRQHRGQHREDPHKFPAVPAQNIADAAEKLGVGFQILDDVQNLAGGNPGKERGDDVVEGKMSLPVLLYLHGEDSGIGMTEKRAFAQRCFTAARKNGVGAPEVAQLIGVLEKSGSLEAAREKGRALLREAEAAFTALPPLPVTLSGEESATAQNARSLLADFVRLMLPKGV
jgi:octaprenyl-diphosphate synthase